MGRWICIDERGVGHHVSAGREGIGGVGVGTIGRRRIVEGLRVTWGWRRIGASKMSGITCRNGGWRRWLRFRLRTLLVVGAHDGQAIWFCFATLGVMRIASEVVGST